MTVVRWSPMGTPRELVGMHDEVSRLFDGLFATAVPRGTDSPAFHAALDVEENAEGFVVRVDVPGIPLSEVKVSLLGETLSIRGERSSEARVKDGRVLRTERRHGAFERSITLDAPVRGDGVKATCRDGVLEIYVPKAEQARVRVIEVKTA